MDKVRKLNVKPLGSPVEHDDGFRVYVERFWPREPDGSGLSVDYWAENLAPSPVLHYWYCKNKEQWCKFKSWYFAELRCRYEDLLEFYKVVHQKEAITLLHNGNDRAHNNAIILAAFLVLEPHFSLLRN